MLHRQRGQVRHGATVFGRHQAEKLEKLLLKALPPDTTAGGRWTPRKEWKQQLCSWEGEGDRLALEAKRFVLRGTSCGAFAAKGGRAREIR